MGSRTLGGGAGVLTGTHSGHNSTGPYIGGSRSRWRKGLGVCDLKNFSVNVYIYIYINRQVLLNTLLIVLMFPFLESILHVASFGFKTI